MSNPQSPHNQPTLQLSKDAIRLLASLITVDMLGWQDLTFSSWGLFMRFMSSTSAAVPGFPWATTGRCAETTSMIALFDRDGQVEATELTSDEMEG
jgi:hypothetical protein